MPKGGERPPISRAESRALYSAGQGAAGPPCLPVCPGTRSARLHAPDPNQLTVVATCDLRASLPASGQLGRTGNREEQDSSPSLAGLHGADESLPLSSQARRIWPGYSNKPSMS